MNRCLTVGEYAIGNEPQITAFQASLFHGVVSANNRPSVSLEITPFWDSSQPQKIEVIINSMTRKGEGDTFFVFSGNISGQPPVRIRGSYNFISKLGWVDILPIEDTLPVY